MNFKEQYLKKLEQFLSQSYSTEYYKADGADIPADTLVVANPKTDGVQSDGDCFYIQLRFEQFNPSENKDENILRFLVFAKEDIKINTDIYRAVSFINTQIYIGAFVAEHNSIICTYSLFVRQDDSIEKGFERIQSIIALLSAQLKMVYPKLSDIASGKTSFEETVWQ